MIDDSKDEHKQIPCSKLPKSCIMSCYSSSFSQKEIESFKMKHNTKPYNVQEQAKKIVNDEIKYQQLRKELAAQKVFTHVALHEVLNRILFEWREEDDDGADIDNKKVSDKKNSGDNEDAAVSGGVGIFRRFGEGMKTRINKVSSVRRSFASIDGSSRMVSKEIFNSSFRKSIVEP